jgi:hypothetical protein
MPRGIMKVSPDLLAELMRLPVGTRIEGAEFDCLDGVISLAVDHPDIAVGEEVRPLFRKQEAVVFEGWR